MTAPALFVTITALLAGGLFVLDQCVFLAQYRAWIWQTYAGTFALWLLTLGANMFGFVYLALRALRLADTGRKLAHVDEELRRGSPIARELAKQLEDR